MDRKEMLDSLECTPVVAAVKNDAGLRRCLMCESVIVFILYGTVNDIARIVSEAKQAGKVVFVHLDLLEGLAAKEAAVDFIAKTTRADGIISTKPALIRYAKHIGLATVQRFFVLDSLALENIRKADRQSEADFIEILPGLMPKIIRRLTAELQRPIIAGGLISDKEDVMTALSAGAVAVSTTCAEVWFL
ncbi:MAG: glycerol-3-phosphate responsive antiterminator [Ruthenibacterium sp.]